MNLSDAQLSEIKSIAAELATLLAEHDAAEDPNQRTKVADRVIEFLRANKSIFNTAHQILDEKIEAAIRDFISATEIFYEDAARARRAAESTDLVKLASHQRNELTGESVESARKIQNILLTVTTANEPNTQKKANK